MLAKKLVNNCSIKADIIACRDRQVTFRHRDIKTGKTDQIMASHDLSLFARLTP